MSLSARVLLPIFALALLGTGFTSAAHGQCISLTTLGSAVTQNLDGLASAGTNIVWTDNSTLPGWYSTRATYNSGTGSSNTGALYSFGVAGTNPATDRAIGGVGSSGTGTFYWAVCFTNNTSATLTSLDVSYFGEQWRDGLPVPAAAQTIAFEYQVAAPGTITDADTPTTGWVAATGLNFTGPIAGTAAAALDGNAAANRAAKVATLTPASSVAPGDQVWMRWRDINDASNDHGLAVDDLSVTPQGSVSPPANLSINDVSINEGNASTTTFTFTVSLSSPAPVGDVSFTIATGDGTAAQPGDYAQKTLSAQIIPAASSTYTFDVLVNGDLTVEGNETFFVNVSSVVGTGVTVTDGQGQGNILNDDVALSFIHDVQGSGAATPVPGATVMVEGVVIGDFQATTQLSGFFLEEEDGDADANPLTSEGIFVYCNSCPTAVAEGQRVRVTGMVAEFFFNTEITASTAGAVVVTDAANHLAEVTPAAIDLPVAGVVNDFYEAREGMRVTFVDTLTVAEYFELARYGQVELFEGGRPRQFTADSAPSVAGYTAHLESLSRRRVILDDDDNSQNVSLNDPNGSQFIFHPRANGGFSVGTQGSDFFRGGDLVTGLTGVLDWSFAGVTGTDAWRIRPTAANPPAFSVTNPRPVTPPAVGGAIRAVGMNLLNYFTTIDTTSSTSSGPCGPGGTLDCRGADSVAELTRQRERASIVICTLNADVYGFGELENTTPSAAITDLLGAVNARCGGAHPYAFANTGGTLGTDAIRVQIIYRTGILAPFGGPLSDLDPIHNRPPTAQTFDVVDATNPAFGERFTVVANHFKSKGSSAGLPGDADAGDGAGFSNATRTLQASQLLAWISGTVLPAAGDSDVLLLGDFNSYAQETPVTTLTGGGYTDLETDLLGPAAYSYLFDGQLGHLDYAFSSASLTPQITGVGAWHINADEADLLDYNDEIKDVGEAAFEEKPDGSALLPPRVLFQPATPYRASDHDPVIVGMFQVADLAVSKVGTPDPVNAGTQLTYTITVINLGPDAAVAAGLSDTLPAGTTFVSLLSPAAWSCTAPGVGAGGTVDCSNPSFAVGSDIFTLVVLIDPATPAATVISNTAAVASTTGDPNPADNSSTSTTTVAPGSASLYLLKDDDVDPVLPGGLLTYTISVSNEGPSNATAATMSDPLPVGTTFQSLSAPADWSCTMPAVGANGTVNCVIGSFAVGTAVFVVGVQVDGSLPGGTVLANTAVATTSTPDPSSGDESDTEITTVGAGSADVGVTIADLPDPVAGGSNVTYTVVVSLSAALTDATAVVLTLPPDPDAGFQSVTAPAGWSCSTPPIGSAGTVLCSIASLPASASESFDLVVAAPNNLPPGATITQSASFKVFTNGRDVVAVDSEGTIVLAPASLSATKTVATTGLPGAAVTYTIVIENLGPATQADNPGDELTDTLPIELDLIGATATSGTAAVDIGNGIVTWNGSIPAGGSVTIVIDAVLVEGTAIGTTIVNQGTLAFDGDGDGTNESSAVTDDPAPTGVDDPTTFVVVAPLSVIEIPALDSAGLAALALLLGGLAIARLACSRRRRAG